jgi:hypothetical protein
MGIELAREAWVGPHPLNCVVARVAAPLHLAEEAGHRVARNDEGAARKIQVSSGTFGQIRSRDLTSTPFPQKGHRHAYRIPPDPSRRRRPPGHGVAVVRGPRTDELTRREALTTLALGGATLLTGCAEARRSAAPLAHPPTSAAPLL